MDLGIAGRTALVTGSFRGTGSAIAASLAAEGAEVWVHGFEPGQPDEVVARIQGAGGTARPIVGDLFSDEGVAELMEQVGNELDICVCNYGLAQTSRWSTVSTDQWYSAYEHNVLSATRVAAVAGPVLAARGWGRIVFLGTVGTVMPAAMRPAYYGAKSALVGLTVSLAKELAATGVTVNLVSPGLIATAEVRERLAGRPLTEVFPDLDTLTGRMAEVDEVADLVAYVCSRQGGAITGTNLRIDGGTGTT